MWYYVILAAVILLYAFATGYWVAQDRYDKKLKDLQQENYYLSQALVRWRFPHAPNDQ